MSRHETAVQVGSDARTVVRHGFLQEPADQQRLLEMIGVGFALPWWNAYLQSGEVSPPGIAQARAAADPAKRVAILWSLIYGFDSAKWVAEDPHNRAHVGPYDAGFVERMHRRGGELLKLIAAGDSACDARERSIADDLFLARECGRLGSAERVLGTAPAPPRKRGPPSSLARSPSPVSPGAGQETVGTWVYAVSGQGQLTRSSTNARNCGRRKPRST